MKIQNKILVFFIFLVSISECALSQPNSSLKLLRKQIKFALKISGTDLRVSKPYILSGEVPIKNEGFNIEENNFVFILSHDSPGKNLFNILVYCDDSGKIILIEDELSIEGKPNYSDYLPCTTILYTR